MADTATLELPQFKGRTGWEFTDLGDFTLEAWEPAPAEGGGWMVSKVLEAPEGAFELLQVDAGTGDGVVADAAGPSSSAAGTGDAPVVLPLSVARERHPELVEPHLGTVVRDTDAFTAAIWSSGIA